MPWMSVCPVAPYSSAAPNSKIYDGGTSAAQTVSVKVVAVNDAPKLTGGTTTTYAETATPLKIGGSNVPNVAQYPSAMDVPSAMPR